MTERRSDPRDEVTASAELLPVGEREAGRLAGEQVRNLSLGGICIETAAPAEVGWVVDVKLSLPELERTLVLRGQVVWRNRQPPADVGIRWSALGDDDRELLRRYLELCAQRPREERP